MVKTIMIVEDDRDFQELYMAMLEGADYKIICAYDGDDALSRMATESPDLIILDITLKLVNGDAFFYYLKNKPEYSNIPVIILSNASKDVCNDLKKVDPNLIFLDKTVTKETLIEQVRANIV